MPKWSKKVKAFAKHLDVGWIYSMDVWITLDGDLLFIEANTASGLDGVAIQDYANFIVSENVIGG